MANKRLDGETLRKFEQLVIEEKTPEDIASLMGISVSSVHNYKRAMRSKGIEVPDVRGKRPQGYGKTAVLPFFRPEILGEYSTPNFVELKVNDVIIRVSSKAKNVTVEGNTVIIEV
jgi:hypothetical protein